MHTFGQTGDYTLPNNAANAPGQAGWSHCGKCSAMFFSLNPGSKCPVTVPQDTHDATTSGGYSIVENVAGDPGQHRWRWCDKCQGIWFPDGNASVCPADGKAHNLGTGDYSIGVNPPDVQANWRKCSRCQSIYYAGNGAGACAAGPGGHDPGASGSYLMISAVSPANTVGNAQTGWLGGWRYCKKCGELWMGLNAGSRCPADSQAHSLADSGEYWLRVTTAAEPGPGETGWARCEKCQSLWSGHANSRCPATGTTHISATSTIYALTVDSFLWHWCSRCQGLWLGTNGSTGVCQAGPGGHSQADSSDYFVVDDPHPTAVPGGPGVQPAGFQDGWRYCTKCQALWMGLNSGSHCPAGMAHTMAGQDGTWEHGNLVLQYSGGAADSPGQQTKWKRCGKCQSLWMGANAGSKCAKDGLEHIAADSNDYMLQYQLMNL